MSAARLNIAVAPSRRHLQVIIGGHLLSLFGVLVVPTAVWAKLALLLLLFGNGYFSHRLLYEQQGITHLKLEFNRLHALHCGQWREVTALEPVLVTSWLTIVKVKLTNKSYVLPLWRDSADCDSLRRLRVWLLAGGWKL